MTTAQRRQVLVLMEQDLFNEIEDYRRTQPVIPSRSEVVQKLLRRGLSVPPSQE